jgi:hypothetical protein
MAAHQTLLRYPVLYFFANIIDPQGKNKQDDVLRAIAKKFDIGYIIANNKVKANNELSEHITWQSKRDKFLSLNKMGTIAIYKEYNELAYKKHTIEIDVYAAFYVNGRLIDRTKGWDDDTMIDKKHSILTLFDMYQENPPEHYMDVFNALWEVFPKGSRDGAASAFCSISEALAGQEEYTDYCSILIEKGQFVKSKYLDYLWGCYDEEKNTQYILGMREFIVRNRDAWLKGEDAFKVKLNIYTDEHDNATELFLKEPPLDLPNTLNIFILEAWINISES